MALHIGIANIGTDNSKTGMPTISTTAVETCKNCANCEKACYARKCEMIHPETKAMHERNTTAIENDLQQWGRDMAAYLAAYRPEAIRMNESGDFNTKNSAEYFDIVMRLAIAFPRTVFQGMTKCDDIVNAWIDAHGLNTRYGLPENVRLSFSDFDGLNNPHGLPVSYIRTKADKKAGVPYAGTRCPNQVQKEAMKKNKNFKPVKKWQCIDCYKHNLGCFANANMVWDEH